MTNNINSVAVKNWISELSESSELECKLAAGRDGKGEIPKDFWKSYSAFANTHGGVILLGIKESPVGRFSVEGVQNAAKLVTDLFNTLNNPSKVSINLIQDSDVEVLNVEGRSVIKVTVPQASRKQKPVYLGDNPLKQNTFRRLHEGDRPCDDESVKRMLAEQVEDERDSKILSGFGWDDIDARSFSVYRQMLKDAKPGHPFLEFGDFDLLKKLKGWREDRQTGKEGLTLAGLLMFGHWDAIQEEAPHYFVDYQERAEAKAEWRWIDRLVPDGTWSGNVFDFYRIVYRKLTHPDSLKVPFRLKADQRQDDTPVHEAIREALVNTLVHADYSGNVSVLVVKRPDMFGFRNPGDMRIPLERAIQGGESDCRNRIMHQMFLMIGLGERAGSGIPKIYSGWKWRHWRYPALYEVNEPPQTRLELRMLELMPEGVVQQLQERFGDNYCVLPELERVILAIAATEQSVSHGRISKMTTDHSHDITLTLKTLVKKGMLEVSGHGRGSVYHLPGVEMPTPELVFGVSMGHDNTPVVASVASLIHSDNRSAQSNDSPEIKTYNDQYGRLLSGALKAPVIDKLEDLSLDLYERLKAFAQLSAESKRLDPEIMRRVILSLCEGHYLTRLCLADLLKRTPDALRTQYLSAMIKDKSLTLAFPQNPNDKRQAYITTSSLLELSEPES